MSAVVSDVTVSRAAPSSAAILNALSVEGSVEGSRSCSMYSLSSCRVCTMGEKMDERSRRKSSRTLRWTANSTGNRPLPLGMLGSAPERRRISTMPLRSLMAAKWRQLLPLVACTATSAPCDRSSTTTSISPCADARCRSVMPPSFSTSLTSMLSLTSRSSTSALAASPAFRWAHISWRFLCGGANSSPIFPPKNMDENMARDPTLHSLLVIW
mmetsp:Transcript_20533/g.45679  ORF Transcript_20533/g.45679 Transcript_20533/m.45679 type:complete len:213 (+) Transcript_20533:2581-3219(+)